MPNWIEGTMKIRGKREDIYRFFKEGLEPSSWAGEVNKLEDQVKDQSVDDTVLFDFKDEPHIKGTRRAFITDDFVEVYFGDDKDHTACVNVKQAWAFDAGSESEDLDNWKAISDQFNLDIKLYGIECGMRFTQEIIIIRGQKPIINERQYEDWDWDCPFPRMGG